MSGSREGLVIGTVPDNIMIAQTGGVCRGPADGENLGAWGRMVAFLLTGRSAIDAVADVPGAWRELLTAWTSVLPEQRPEASAVRGSPGG
jgi:hypothetical protein